MWNSSYCVLRYAELPFSPSRCVWSAGKTVTQRRTLALLFAVWVGEHTLALGKIKSTIRSGTMLLQKCSTVSSVLPVHDWLEARRQSLRKVFLKLSVPDCVSVAVTSLISAFGSRSSINSHQWQKKKETEPQSLRSRTLSFRVFIWDVPRQCKLPGPFWTPF